MATEHSIPSTCLNLSTDKVKGQPKEEVVGIGRRRRRRRCGGGWQGVSFIFPACCVSSEVPPYVLVLVLSSKDGHFSQKEKVEAGRCFSLSAHGHVGCPDRQRFMGN